MAAVTRRWRHTLERLPSAPFPILRTVDEVRRWRLDKLLRRESVGFVPTMGCLHAGHLNLVQHSLSATRHTIASIFVNPAQFAPHEDLATYPRTLQQDIDSLAKLTVEPNSLRISSDFASQTTGDPTPTSTAHSGIEQDVSQQLGTFVEVKGFSHQMEGTSRPTFFRGVSTVVLKLFNIIQPDVAFFGQKDIQQCLVLRQMLRDLHLPNPPSPYDLVIIPTTRDSLTGLALSSRNHYLSPQQLQVSTCLSQSLFTAKRVFDDTLQRQQTVSAQQLRQVATQFVNDTAKSVPSIKLDYISVNDPVTLKTLDQEQVGYGRRGIILSGAMWCGKTRLIDNLVLNHDLNARP